MKKIMLVISILVLILITSLVKNSTKKIEDEIFLMNGKIRGLNVELGEVLLEFNYLSSPGKLKRYHSLYFNEDLMQIDISKIKKITEKNSKLIITNFVTSENND
jgi:hypothetical protein